jgi:hypothetical protein
VVEVEHEQGQDPAEAPRPLDLLLEAALEVAVVPGPGERVGDRQPFGSACSWTFSMATAACTANAVMASVSARVNGSPSSRSYRLSTPSTRPWAATGTLT